MPTSGGIIRIRFDRKHEQVFAAPKFTEASVYEAHPLLAEHIEPTLSVFIGTKANANAVLDELRSIAKHQFGGWREPRRYLNTDYSPERVLNEGSGLLVRGPSSFAVSACDVLKQHGVRLQVDTTRPAFPDSALLLLGQSFVVADKFRFEGICPPSIQIERGNSCSRCGAPDRLLWTFGQPPNLEELETGDWNWLEQCEACGSLWVCVAYEPYASFKFWTLWPGTRDSWARLNSRENARIVHEWHAAVLRENWHKLPLGERGHVEAWRDRTYRHYNPIDRGPDVPKPVDISTPSDIDKFLDGA